MKNLIRICLLLLLLGLVIAHGAQLWLNRGNAANDDTGDTPRDFLGKCNTNFAEIYAATRVLTNMPSLATLWVQTNQSSMEPATTEESLITSGSGNGIGSRAIGSNTWIAGRSFALVAAGFHANGDGGNAVLAWKIGSVVLLSNLAVATGPGPTTHWRFEGRVTLRSSPGTSATAYGSGWLSVGTNGLIPIVVTSTVNTTTNATMDLTWRHSLGSANNTVVCDQCVIRAEY